MKKRKVIALMVVVIIFIGILVSFFGIPQYRFNKDYDSPHDLTPEQTIEKLFDYINNNSPKQANIILLESKYGAFSFNTIISAHVNNIDDFGSPPNKEKYKNYYDSKQYLVSYDISYLPFAAENVFWGPSGSIFFVLVKETEDSDWKIADMYTGV